MFVSDIIKNPFFWLILVLIITVIVYFVLNNPTPNIRTTCTSDQELIDGKCLDKCGVGRIRCGTTTTCYDPNQQYCDSRSQVCSISNKNCNKCCPDGSSCQNGVCTTCPVNLKCGTKCCDDASQCCNNNECCTKDAVCTKDGCCEPPNTVCGDECCNVSAGLVCVDGKCQIGCPAPDPITKKLPDGFTGTPVACDPNTSVCFQNPTIKDINQQYQCLPTGCGWGDFSYTPPQDYTDSNGTPVHVCGDPNGNLWISKNNMTDLTSSVNVNIKNFDPDKCTNDTCFQKIYQAGSTELKGLNVDDLKAGKITGNTCSSELLCSDILLPFDQGKLKNICEDRNSSLYGQCCYDKNSEYTGQICQKGDVCLFDKNNNNKCYPLGLNTDYCNNVGKLNKNEKGIVSCVCDNPSIYTSARNCSKIRWDEVYTLDYFINWYKNSFSNKYNVNCDKSFPPLPGDPYPGPLGWSQCLIFIVCNNIKKWTTGKWTNTDIMSKYIYCMNKSSTGPVVLPKDVNGNDITPNLFDSSENNNNINVFIQVPNVGPYGLTATVSNPPTWTISGDIGTLTTRIKSYASGTLADNSPGLIVISAAEYFDGTDTD